MRHLQVLAGLMIVILVLPVYSNSQDYPPFLEVTPQMVQFLEKHVLVTDSPRDRLKFLVTAMFDRTLLGFQYEGNRTYTASETFKNRTGNCLSYTALFVAMARHAGLSAYFQEVYSYFHWTRRNETVILNRHVNALVIIEGKKYDVDFDYSAEKRFQQRQRVSDQRARAHYYNNIGAEALMTKDYALARTLLQKSLACDPGFSSAWTNLGLLHQWTGRVLQAEFAYKKAASLEKRNHSALSNLSNLYRQLGEKDKEARIRKRVQRYREKNPFYHFGLGRKALNRLDYPSAVGYFRRAIKRESNEPEFYASLAAAYYKLGHRRAAEKNLRKAERLAKTDRDRHRYSGKLSYLYSLSRRALK